MTQTQTHTPGPWHIGMKPGPMIYDKEGAQVANMSIPMLPADEHLANVRLIAAAPDLLAALQALMADIDRMEVGRDASLELFVATNKIARAAIAKATGGAS